MNWAMNASPLPINAVSTSENIFSLHVCANSASCRQLPSTTPAQRSSAMPRAADARTGMAAGKRGGRGAREGSRRRTGSEGSAGGRPRPPKPAGAGPIAVTEDPRPFAQERSSALPPRSVDCDQPSRLHE
jgi:hypothetical protein